MEIFSISVINTKTKQIIAVSWNTSNWNYLIGGATYDGEWRLDYQCSNI